MSRSLPLCKYTYFLHNRQKKWFVLHYNLARCKAVFSSAVGLQLFCSFTMCVEELQNNCRKRALERAAQERHGNWWGANLFARRHAAGVCVVPIAMSRQGYLYAFMVSPSVFDVGQDG